MVKKRKIQKNKFVAELQQKEVLNYDFRINATHGHLLNFIL